MLTPSAQKVQNLLAEKGLSFQVRELAESTRTSEDAARAVGCSVEQIAKTLVFRTAETRAPIIVIASGARRVDERLIARAVGEPVEKARADFVREATGFAIGGVPPVGYPQPIRTFLDEALLAYDAVWSAAGTPHAVFPLSPRDLLALTGGEVIAVTENQ